MSTSTPVVDTAAARLLASLEQSAQGARPPQGVPVALPLPGRLVRAALAASLLLMLVWCGLLVWFSRDAQALAQGVRKRQAELHALRFPAMPTVAQLVQDQVFADALERFPQRHAEVWERRALALVTTEAAAAVEAFEQAQALATRPLADASRWRWAQALAALERDAEALERLWTLRLSQLDPEDRQAAVALLTRLHGTKPHATIETH